MTQNTPSDPGSFVEPSKVGINQDLILDAQKYVQDARRELVQAISDDETAPILAAKVDELGRAEGELQAFQDAVDFEARYPRAEVLARLTESIHDPVLVHDIRREGYKRAVSHIFRGTR